MVPSRTFFEDFYLQTSRVIYPKDRARTPGSIGGYYGYAMILLDLSTQDIHLVRLRVSKLLAGQGHGSEALKWICKLADKHQCEIVLHPIANNHNFLSTRQLRNWYARHDFVARGRTWMIRVPRNKGVEGL